MAEDISFKLSEFDASGVVFVNGLEEGVDVLAFDGDLKLGNQVSHLIDREMARLVQVEVTEHFFKRFRVFTCQFENTGAHFAVKVTDNSLGLGAVLIFGYLPCALHHLNEVLVRRNAHANIAIVVTELIKSDNTIIVAAYTIELVKEVGENLVLGGITSEEFGVFADIIDTTDVRDGELARVVFVKHVECLHDHLLAPFGQLVSEATEELFEANSAAAVNVVELHEGLQLNFLGEETKGSKCLFKFTHVKGLRSVKVHAGEDML